jgi:hypothetical protein
MILLYTFLKFLKWFLILLFACFYSVCIIYMLGHSLGMCIYIHPILTVSLIVLFAGIGIYVGDLDFSSDGKYIGKGS